MIRQSIRYLAVAGATAAMLAGCSSAPDAPSTETANQEDAMAAYQACMRDQGIEEVDNGSGVIEITPTGGGDITEALDACADLADDAFGEFELDPEQEAEMRDRELAFARCMRENGVADFADPEPGANGSRTIEADGDTDPEVLDAAFETCGEEVYGGSVNTQHITTTQVGEQ